MNPKNYIISLSLTGAAAALGCWLFMGETSEAEPAAKARVKSTRPLTMTPVVAASPHAGKSKVPSSPRGEESASLPKTAARSAPPPTVSEPATPAARAARVEQEANHELRRLVTLLNLDENQQEVVFQTLARNSRYWTPDMQIAGVEPVTATGKRGPRPDTTIAPALILPGTETPLPEKTTTPSETVPTPADSTGVPATTPAPATTQPITGAENTSDTLSEILALLTPEQQAALIESEMDRAAWWEEILPQILPPEEVPPVDTGEKAYEGSEVLE